MITDHDRSGWFGASDTDKIMGPWTSATFQKWWMVKCGLYTDTFHNRAMDAGTHWEHRILNSMGIPLELDKQVLLPEYRLRVNLDGNTETCIYECKTTGAGKPFKMPAKYINQVNVQMFATGMRQARIVVYALEEEDYYNYFRDIDPERRTVYNVEYDDKFIAKYVDRLRYLAERMKEGRAP